MARGLLCAAAMVLSAFGCESMSPPEVEDTALVTDGTGFRFEEWGSIRGEPVYQAEIPYSFTNRTGSKVYLPTCDGGIHLRLEMEGMIGEWIHLWGPVLLLCQGPPIVIEPGEVYRRTLGVIGCLDGNCSPRLVLPPTAATPVRILWEGALSSYDEDKRPYGERIPLEERISNRFTLKLSH